MKKTFLAVTLLASLGMASSVMAATGDILPTGSTTIQWSGEVPAKTVDGAGYWIVQDGAIGFNDGILVFKNTATGVELNSSSEIGFKVVQDLGVAGVAGADGVYQEATDIAPMKYNYTLTNIKVGVNGVPTSQSADGGLFAVHANGGAALVVGTATTTASDAPTKLTVKTAANPTATPLVGGDAVLTMAMVSVSPLEL